MNGLTRTSIMKEYEDIIKEWLRGAKDRDRGSKNRFCGPMWL